MRMDETAARRVMLARAVETADTEGKLLSEVEREQVDRQARQAAGVGSDGSAAVAPEHFLHVRAQQVLLAVGHRNPGIAALQDAPSWRQWLAIGTPLAALVAGVLTDIVANPHRVDLVSLPLLGIVGWNLVMYLVLIGGWMLGSGEGSRPALAGLGRWSDGERAMQRRKSNLRTSVTALFHLHWYRATQALHLQRVKRVLHLAAAGWAVGVALSLLARGLVVEYRVGWESTFLDAQQVHTILSVLRLPALLLFPFQSFSIEEVAALRFSQGGGAVAGARWVYLYVALLLVVVVLPRLALAAAAWWRERRLAQGVAIDLRDPYYQRVVSLLSSARVQLCLVTHRDEDRAAWLRVAQQEPGSAGTLIRSAHDDVLRFVDVSGLQPPAPQAVAPETGWARRLLDALRGRPPQARLQHGEPALAAAREHCDLAIHVAGAPDDLAAATPLLAWLGKPVLVLVNRPDAPEAAAPGLVARCEAQLRDLPPPARLLSFDAFARCWVQERVLINAIGSLLPESKVAGFARLASAWDERNAQRFTRSMAAVAEHLLFAARQVEEVRTGALTVKSMAPAERQAQAQARQTAMDAVVERLDGSAAEMFARLRQLHGLNEQAAGTLQHHMEQKFAVQQAIDKPQAGMAGAATGAAMGASVDLLVGGLTLGAAAALGAVVGGSAAYIGAAWKNRSSAGGNTVVQLSDEMMQAMAEAGLLRYLAVIHFGRGPAGAESELQPFWKRDVVAAVEESRALLTPFWTAARTQPDPGRLAQALARELETIARKVLEGLYPPRRGSARRGAEP